MRALLCPLLLLALGCARAATSTAAGDDAGLPGDEPPALKPDGATTDKAAPAAGPDGSAPVGGDDAADPGIIPPSRRDGGIPRQPPGAPPCAADSNAADGNACPYKAIVECTPVRDAGPVQVCICLGTLGGKWYCQEARDGGGVRP